MSVQLIPLTPTASDQYFNASLAVDGGLIVLQFHLHFNAMAQYWVADIFDQSGNLLLTGVPLITAGNILSQFGYLNIGSSLIFNAGGITSLEYPDASDLGSDFQLIWGDTPAA